MGLVLRGRNGTEKNTVVVAVVVVVAAAAAAVKRQYLSVSILTCSTWDYYHYYDDDDDNDEVGDSYARYISCFHISTIARELVPTAGDVKTYAYCKHLT